MFIFSPVTVFAGVHSVIAEKPLYLTDGETGEHFTIERGYSTTNWKAGTRHGFFYAAAEVIPDAIPLRTRVYEFILISISGSSKASIQGLWDIRRDGSLLCEGCVGRAYAIDQPVGNYFKLYVGDSECHAEKWHFSAYITDRFDF